MPSLSANDLATVYSTGQHQAKFSQRGGRCQECPIRGHKLHLYSCSCGAYLLCNECMRDHLQEERKRLGLFGKGAGRKSGIMKMRRTMFKAAI